MTHTDTPANLTAAARAAVAAIVSGPTPDADVLAALAPVLAVRHLMTPDGITCATADQLAAVEFTAERVTCPDCLRRT